MRETIIQRRAAIEDALRDRLPDVGEFDQYREDPVSIGRPRTRGQVFLAMVDGATAGSHATDRLVPVAVAFELASLQSSVHRTTIECARSKADGYDPTRDILRGDLLESTAFETMLSVRSDARSIRRWFGVLVRASRRVQEGHAMVYGADETTSWPDTDVVRRLGALTGGVAEIAGLVADLDAESRRRLVDHGSALGFHVWSHATVEMTPSLEGLVSSNPVDACRRHVDALADCYPAGSGDRIRRQLHAFLEESTDHESVEPTP